MAEPSTLKRPISPPPVSKRRKISVSQNNEENKLDPHQPSLAAIEAGRASVEDHLRYFAGYFTKVARTVNSTDPRVSISDFVSLYQRNQHLKGRHFVIHQHNHPVAGVHYDLRLQFSETSAISFAIPYGVPGNPNSKRQGRMGIETRVHNLWNNLIESASHATGSLLIWDTGEYSILPRRKKQVETDDEPDTSDVENSAGEHILSDSEKLYQAFQSRYIRLRLHGTRLPRNYTVTVRLPSANDIIKQSFPRRRKLSKHNTQARIKVEHWESDTEYNDAPIPSTTAEDEAVANASEDENESSTIRENNAYTGATNSIGSVHQRHWFVSLDKPNSGFKKQDGKWIPDGPGKGFDAFFVRGAEMERSVVTGRLSAEVMEDEGVKGFKARGKWRPVLE